jgi:hypothetical protein
MQGTRLEQVAFVHRPLLLSVRRVVAVHDIDVDHVANALDDADVDEGARGAAAREADQVGGDAIAVGDVVVVVAVVAIGAAFAASGLARLPGLGRARQISGGLARRRSELALWSLRERRAGLIAVHLRLRVRHGGGRDEVGHGGRHVVHRGGRHALKGHDRARRDTGVTLRLALRLALRLVLRALLRPSLRPLLRLLGLQDLHLHPVLLQLALVALRQRLRVRIRLDSAMRALRPAALHACQWRWSALHPTLDPDALHDPLRPAQHRRSSRYPLERALVRDDADGWRGGDCLGRVHPGRRQV